MVTFAQGIMCRRARMPLGSREVAKALYGGQQNLSIFIPASFTSLIAFQSWMSIYDKMEPGAVGTLTTTLRCGLMQQCIVHYPIENHKYAGIARNKG